MVEVIPPDCPWMFDRDEGFIIDKMRNCVAIVCLGYDDGGNAMAAAPEMLAALRDAVAAYGQPGGPRSVPSDPGGWLARARAAIAKAEGKA